MEKGSGKGEKKQNEKGENDKLKELSLVVGSWWKRLHLCGSGSSEAEGVHGQGLWSKSGEVGIAAYRILPRLERLGRMSSRVYW